MLELRKDYILDRYAIIAEKRKHRPRQISHKEIKENIKTCYFCPGNEKTTPKEKGRVEFKSKWLIRWFPNLFPAVELKGSPTIKGKKFIKKSAAYGYHEVIVETPEHDKQLADLSTKHIAEVLKVYSLRIKELSKNSKYVVVFKNQGRMAATTLVHSHTQVLAYPKIPEAVKEKLNAVKKYKKCPYCDIIKQEMNSPRRIFQNKNFVSFAPFAPRFNYEAWIFPKKHVKNITELEDIELISLAEIIKKILSKLSKITDSYNMLLYYAPKGTNLHFHIEITPRIAIWGGFELATGAVINSVAPETAAEFYRS